jgi:hypothetical protein
VNLIRTKRPRLRMDPELYEQLREVVLNRDGWRCQLCCAMSNLEVHHSAPGQKALTTARLRTGYRHQASSLPTDSFAAKRATIQNQTLLRFVLRVTSACIAAEDLDTAGCPHSDGR